MNELIDRCHEYQKHKKAPGMFPCTYMKSPKCPGCSGGRSYYYINPYGEVRPYDFLPVSVGNITQTPLQVLWPEFRKRPELSCTSDGCKMQNREFRKKYEALLTGHAN